MNSMPACARRQWLLPALFWTAAGLGCLKKLAVTLGAHRFRDKAHYLLIVHTNLAQLSLCLSLPHRQTVAGLPSDFRSSSCCFPAVG
jgi:hypothetical protein